MSRKAVFLDRDGTINYDPGYLDSPEKFKFLPGAVAALRGLREAGYLLFVVSNQSGIARGFIRREVLRKIHERMREILSEEGVTMDGIYCCPHHPDENCRCRKPSPELVLRAAEEHDLDLEGSFFVGDRETDIETGVKAGCRTVLVLTGSGRQTEKLLSPGLRPDFTARDLADAAGWILKQFKV